MCRGEVLVILLQGHTMEYKMSMSLLTIVVDFFFVHYLRVPKHTITTSFSFGQLSTCFDQSTFSEFTITCRIQLPDYAHSKIVQGETKCPQQYQ